MAQALAVRIHGRKQATLGFSFSCMRGSMQQDSGIASRRERAQLLRRVQTPSEVLTYVPFFRPDLLTSLFT